MPTFNFDPLMIHFFMNNKKLVTIIVICSNKFPNGSLKLKLLVFFDEERSNLLLFLFVINVATVFKPFNELLKQNL